MNFKITAVTTLVLSISSNAWAAEADIEALKGKVDNIELNLIEGGISPDPSELEAIKHQIILNEISSTELTIKTSVSKYSLTTDEERKLIIKNSSRTFDDGGGIEP
jgi:hypothetical protein